MLVLNGISSPIQFGWELFLFMEVMTMIIEIITFTILYFWLNKDAELDAIEIIAIICFINLISALFCLPYWSMIGD